MANDLTEAGTLLFELAQRQLGQQNSDLDALRTRAVAMLSVASLVAGLFGPRLQHGHLSTRMAVGVTAALTSFAIMAVLVALVAAPRKRWLFTFHLDQLLKLVNESTAKSVDVTYNLANWMEEARRWNRAKLDHMNALFGLICTLVGLQVIAWAVAVL